MANSKYGRIIAIATSVCAILLEIAFIVSVAHLYYTGEDTPYTRERVGDYLTWLIIPSVITILLFIVGIIYNVITGTSDVENTKRTNRELLKSLEERYDCSGFDKDTVAIVAADEKSTRNLGICFNIVSAVLFVVSFAYLIFVADFSVETLNADVMSAFSVILPLCAVALAVHIPKVYFEEVKAKHQVALMKESIRVYGAPNKSEKKKSDRCKTIVGRYVILGVAILLIVLGVFNGGMSAVLQKAVKICTECIGLG